MKRGVKFIMIIKFMYFIISILLITNINAQTVTNPITGKTWMDRNLGASQIATSITDANAFGDLYQWGRLGDGHESRTSSTTTTESNTDVPGHSLFILADPDWRLPSNDNLWQGVNGINNPCPQGFRLPTEDEFEEERLSWTSNDATGAFNSPLKLTLTGARSRNSGQIGNVGTFAGYRTSTLNGVSTRVLGISLTNSFIGTRERADGNCIRCIMDNLNLGDINGDNLINVLDVISTVNFVLNNEFNVLADLNSDGVVNVLDIVDLVNIILGN
jgi:hypothetical protein